MVTSLQTPQHKSYSDMIALIQYSRFHIPPKDRECWADAPGPSHSRPRGSCPNPAPFSALENQPYHFDGQPPRFIPANLAEEPWAEGRVVESFLHDQSGVWDSLPSNPRFLQVTWICG